MEKVTVTLNGKELEMVYLGLLELPAKISLSVIQEIKNQVNVQVDKEQKKEESNETSSVENV